MDSSCFYYVTVLIQSMKNTVTILALELHKTSIIKTLLEKTVDNKTFSSQSRSAENQPAKKNKIRTQDPFTCASRQSQEQGSLMHTRRLLSGVILWLLKRWVSCKSSLPCFLILLMYILIWSANYWKNFEKKVRAILSRQDHWDHTVATVSTLHSAEEVPNPLPWGAWAFTTHSAGSSPSFCVPAHKNTEMLGEKMPRSPALFQSGTVLNSTSGLPPEASPCCSLKTFKDRNSATSVNNLFPCCTTAWCRCIPAARPPAQVNGWEAVAFPTLEIAFLHWAAVISSLASYFLTSRFWGY